MKTTGGGDAAATRACVILPDAASSPRWENNDRPYLEEGLEAAGFETDIQNAQGDVNKYATIADQQLSQGCGVMLLVDYNGAGGAVAEKAKAEGIPVIAYDRPIEGADYYVSFDNLEVGRLEGQSIVDGLAAAGKDPAAAKVVYMGGDPADGNAKMFHDGAVEVMEAAGISPAAEPPGVWDGEKTATNFEQALTALGRRGRRGLGGERHERRGRDHDPRQERPRRSGLGSGRVDRRPAERAARQADRHGLQADQARGRRRGRARRRAPRGRDADRRPGAGGRHPVHRGDALSSSDPSRSSTSSTPATPTRPSSARAKSRRSAANSASSNRTMIGAPGLGGTTAGVRGLDSPPSVGRRVPH